LVGLTELNCSNNQIAFLPPTMRYLNRLVILRASQNKLVFLPIELQSIRTLREIDLSGNNICELPYNFGNHVSLNCLQLGANRLTWLPLSFGNLLSLKSLTLSQNPIAALCLMPSNSEDWENQGFGAASSGSSTPTKKQAKPKMKLSEAQDRVEAWRRVIDKWGDITYVNTVTKTAMRTLPDAVCLLGRDAVMELRTINISEGAYRVEKPDPDDELYASGVGVHDDPEMVARVEATKKYRRDMERRRLELKEDGKREWEVLADPETGEAYYWNHISRTRRDDMPSSLDKFGGLQRLETLVINAGDLQSLPSVSCLILLKYFVMI
jgi:Leucine-rich repeat (LRR) protein